MRKRVRGIILDGKNIILMKRQKEGREYWVFPGGMVERGETLESALKRECREELGIDIAVKKLILKKELNLYTDRQMEYFYLCEKTGGQLGTGQGPEFSRYKKVGWGTHEPMAVPIGVIARINLLPEEAKEIIKKSSLDKL